MRAGSKARRHVFHGFACALCFALLACSNSDAGDAVSPEPSLAIFEQDVYPLLLRDCGFSECHGKPERFFQVWGPGRTRLRMSTMPGDDVTQEEIKRSYERSRAMLATSADVDDSLFLRKPLEPNAGGQGHKGVDEFGRNVYRYREDPAFVILSGWAHSALTDRALPPAGSAGMAAAGSGVAGMGGVGGGP